MAVLFCTCSDQIKLYIPGQARKNRWRFESLLRKKGGMGMYREMVWMDAKRMLAQGMSYVEIGERLGIDSYGGDG